MRILVVTPFGTTLGGAEQWLLTFLRNTTGSDVHVVMLRDGDLRPAIAELGCTVEVIDTGRDAAAIATSARHLLRVLRDQQPAVVMGNGVKAQVALIAPARRLGIPSVWVKHDYSFDATLARPLGWLSTTIVAAADELAAPVGREDALIVEPARPPQPLSVDDALGVLADRGFETDGGPTLAMIGRLVPYKGVDVALRALAYEEARHWRVVVIGEDDPATPGEMARLQQIAQSLRVDDRVQFLGAIPQASRVVGAFDALGVLTRPGQANAPQQEGYGTTATEAMVAGIPVIYAGTGAVARRLDTSSGPAGLVVRAGDPLSTAKALAVLADPAVREVMGEAGRNATDTLPDPREMAATVRRALASAVAGARGRVIP